MLAPDGFFDALNPDTYFVGAQPEAADVPVVATVESQVGVPGVDMLLAGILAPEFGVSNGK